MAVSILIVIPAREKECYKKLKIKNTKGSESQISVFHYPTDLFRNLTAHFFGICVSLNPLFSELA